MKHILKIFPLHIREELNKVFVKTVERNKNYQYIFEKVYGRIQELGIV